MIIIDISAFFFAWGNSFPIKKKMKYKKSKPPSVNGMLGMAYIADKSRHPV